MAKTMYRMLEVNMEDGSYRTIYGEQPEYDNICTEIEHFVATRVHPHDRANFLEYFYDRYKRMPKEVDKVFYRRLDLNGEYRIAVMETMELNNPIVLVTVRDVEKYIQDFLTQIKE